MAKADTPTPTPIESIVNPEDHSDIPAGFYFVPLISRGAWGYGQAYLRFDQTTTGTPGYITEWEFTGIQGYYNYIEYTTISLGEINYDVSVFDDFIIGYYWRSDNVLVTIDSVTYNGLTFYDGETGFTIGGFTIKWGSSIGDTALAIQYTGDMNDIESLLDIIQGHYLTLNTTYSVSAPDTVTMYGLAGFVKEDEPQPTPVWLEPPSFPEVETDEPMPGDEPSYNGILGNLYSTLVWIGNYIRTAVETIIGTPEQLQLPTWDTFLIQSGMGAIIGDSQETGLIVSIKNHVQSLQNVQANGTIAFGGWVLPLKGKNLTIINAQDIDIKGYTDLIQITAFGMNASLTAIIKYVSAFPICILSIYGIIRRFKLIIKLVYGGVG